MTAKELRDAKEAVAEYVSVNRAEILFALDYTEQQDVAEDLRKVLRDWTNASIRFIGETNVHPSKEA